MKNNLQELKVLVYKLSTRINNVSEDAPLSMIERDIILELLRKAYVATEELSNQIKAEDDIKIKLEEPYKVQEFEYFSEQAIKSEEPKVSDNHRVSDDQYRSADTEANIPIVERVTTGPEITDNPVIINAPSVKESQGTGEPVPAPENKPEPIVLFPTFESKKSEATSHSTIDLFSGQTIADKLKTSTPSLNDTITSNKEDLSLAHKMQLKPISDLKAAIGINEKFQFINDLFEGRTDRYNDAITRLNSCSSINEASIVMSQLNMEHKWNKESDAYNKLNTFLSRRYL
mgnify:CR=1 FL=1|jgi:hypothetical protein